MKTCGIDVLDAWIFAVESVDVGYVCWVRNHHSSLINHPKGSAGGKRDDFARAQTGDHQ